MDERTITYFGGFWSTNVGNSFYDLAIINLLKKAAPDYNVIFCDDQPGNYWRETGTNPKNSLKYIGNVNSEYVAISGPLLNKNFPLIWEKAFEKYSEKGIKILLISAGCSAYTDEEVEMCRAFLSKYPPHMLLSRDEFTYNNFSDLALHAYNGICCAFFIADFFPSYNTSLDAYITFNFDASKLPPFLLYVINLLGMSNEPNLYFDPQYEKKGLHFEFMGKKWTIDYSNKSYNILNILKKTKYKYPSNVEEYMLVRTIHKVVSVSKRQAFIKPNTFLSDIPYTYLNIYANSSATFSDRVHACVATLSYGNPAMLFSNTKRARLFERFTDLNDIYEKPVSINKATLETEKEMQLEFLSFVLSKGEKPSLQ
ncbi:polysaccharide pyruvyl transferase family protein [Methanolobus sp. WCC1]|jgi:hypothetical protein|uniref:polysaccharide pyruvyl transferase family protein n=1 Tax=unclassified Methanolobus TaxID=2629569 RepID=UPI0032566E83